MGLYNVVAPCVVNEFHFTRCSTKPIEVDDEVALPLVVAGKLEPVGVFVAPALGVDFAEPFAVVVAESDEDVEADETPARRRARRRPEDGE